MNQAVEKSARNAGLLRALHQGPQILVLPNAWDAASAKAFEGAGFPAIATTSGGVCASLGYKDGENAPVEEVLAATARIIAAVEIPVSVDFEAGYGLPAHGIAEKLILVGAAGLNLEDSDHHSTDTLLVDADDHARRISDLKAACQTLGADLVLNARVDVFIRQTGTVEEQTSDGLRRAELYKAAGADSIYPITLSDKERITRFVDAVGTINVNLRRGGPLSLREVAALGVRRVSYATSIFRAALDATQAMARDIAEEQSGVPL